MKPGEGWKIVMPATESLLLQAGYALLIAAMLVPRLEALRILVALFALVGIARAAFWTSDWTSAAWLAANTNERAELRNGRMTFRITRLASSGHDRCSPPRVLEPTSGLEPETSSLPRKCSAY